MLYKIYKIVNDIDDRIYIGSTKQPLYKRWNEHKKRWRRKDLRQYRSSILFDFCGYNNCKIVLEEEFEADNIEQVRKKEREVIDKFKTICVNGHLPFKTKEEHDADKKRYTETRNEMRSLRCCCILCKSEMFKYSLSKHYNVKH